MSVHFHDINSALLNSSTRVLQLYWELLWILKKLEQSQITTPGSVGDILFPSGMIVFLFTSFGILRQQNRHVCDTINTILCNQHTIPSCFRARLLACADRSMSAYAPSLDAEHHMRQIYAAHKQAIPGCSDKPRAATCIPFQPWIQVRFKNRT